MIEERERFQLIRDRTRGNSWDRWAAGLSLGRQDAGLVLWALRLAGLILEAVFWVGLAAIAFNL